LFDNGRSSLLSPHHVQFLVITRYIITISSYVAEIKKTRSPFFIILVLLQCFCPILWRVIIGHPRERSYAIFMAEGRSKGALHGLGALR
jgi:hypothetical protein